MTLGTRSIEGGDGVRNLDPSVRDRVTVDVVVPAHNEQALIGTSVERLVELSSGWATQSRIVVVDSASSDRTWADARDLAHRWPVVEAMRVELPGRGRALRAAWSCSTADVLAYSDADLSADPQMLRTLVGTVVDGADVVVASRLARGAVVDRGAKRELLSRGYAGLLAWLAAPPFRDAQCGLKACRGAAIRELLPLVRDEQWFFDSELLLLAWSRGYSVIEVPIRWNERVESTVDVHRAAAANLAGLARMTRDRLLQSSRPPVQQVLLAGVRRAGMSVTGSLGATALVCMASRGQRGRPGLALVGLGAISLWRVRRARSREVDIGFLIDDGVAAGLVLSALLRGRPCRRSPGSIGAHLALTCLHLLCLGVWEPTDAGSPPAGPPHEGCVGT